LDFAISTSKQSLLGLHPSPNLEDYAGTLCIKGLTSRRFLGLKKIGGTGFKTGVAVAIVVYIWIHNVAFNTPLFVWSNLYTSRKSGRLVCGTRADAAYTLVTRIINFYAPLALTWSSYVGIIYSFKRSMNKVPSLRRLPLEPGRVSVFSWYSLPSLQCNQLTRSTQTRIPPGSLNRVPALIGWGKGGNVASTGRGVR